MQSSPIDYSLFNSGHSDYDFAFFAAAPNYVQIGCYKDRFLDRAMHLLANYRDPADNSVDWRDLQNSVVKKCANEVKQTLSLRIPNNTSSTSNLDSQDFSFPVSLITFYWRSSEKRCSRLTFHCRSSFRFIANNFTCSLRVRKTQLASAHDAR